VRSYEDLRARAERATIAGVPVLVASVDDLVAMKEAAGRDQDRIDVAALRAIKRRTG
jgi:hypothetical protein